MATVETTRPATVAEHRVLWWKEAVLVAAFYGLYSLVRNQFGSAQLAPGEAPVEAFENALRVIRWERWLGIYDEQRIQEFFLGWGESFIRFWNVYYGTLHFVVTGTAFILLFVKDKERFPRWRNALLFTTGFAIVGFMLFPLMPPRLLNEPPPWGGAELATQEYGFEDTMATIGGLWSFDDDTMASISNQYAAMPSLHCAWAMWCTLALWPLARRTWAKALLILYPVATVFCIVVTGNHFFLDAVGGAIILAAGVAVGFGLDRAWRDHRRRHDAASVATGAA
jgi:membrane-associated phospholipid phosphatase